MNDLGSPVHIHELVQYRDHVCLNPHELYGTVNTAAKIDDDRLTTVAYSSLLLVSFGFKSPRENKLTESRLPGQ